MGLQGKELLIVDDAADSRLLARRIAESSGMNVTEVSSVREAWQAMARRTPHAVLLDLHLLGATGFEFLEKRAADPSMSGVPVIVVSAAADQASVRRAIAMGATDYAVKPIRAAVLVQKIRKALRDLQFKVYRVPAGTREPVELLVQGQVSRPAETEIYLESPVKLAAQARIQLGGEGFDELGLDQCVFISDGFPNVRGASGSYFTRVNVMGMDRSLTRALKKVRSG